ncbi:Oncosphere antigen A [Taenia solium]|eukprot:TsM_000058400 transcript=TsM_000058400 gene=TsM_000058400
MRTGSSDSRASWCSVANLTRHQREYTMRDPTPLTPYSVTVRGRMQPNTFSEMGEPVELTRLDPDLSVPHDVQLVATDCHTVHMSWDPPVQSYGRIAGYKIWILDGVRDEYITVRSGCSYNLTNLEPGRDVLASVRAESYPLSLMRLRYVGTFSTAAEVTTQQCEEGEFVPPPSSVAGK